MLILASLFSDQRCYRKRLQLGLFHSPDRGWKLLYAQSGPGCAERVSLCDPYLNRGADYAPHIITPTPSYSDRYTLTRSPTPSISRRLLKFNSNLICILSFSA